MSEGQMRMYHDTLADLSPLMLDMALKRYIKEGSPFMPKVAELRRMEAQVRSSNRDKDVLQLIPGAAQTEEDLDDRYGTREEHRAICDVLTSGGELSDLTDMDKLKDSFTGGDDSGTTPPPPPPPPAP